MSEPEIIPPATPGYIDVPGARCRVGKPLTMKWPDGKWYKITPWVGEDGKPTLAIEEDDIQDDNG